MPKGPQGQKRPADTVANAIRVAKILTGEVEEDMGDWARTPPPGHSARKAEQHGGISFPLSGEPRLHGTRRQSGGGATPNLDSAVFFQTGVA